VQIEWLEGLESRVHEAVDRLGELRVENRELRGRIDELEARLGAVSDEPAEPTLFDAPADRGQEVESLQARVHELEVAAKAWEVERDEVRRRVEALTERLEGMAGL
jgi:FtsZ-binding cell division protein ZapB